MQSIEKADPLLTSQYLKNNQLSQLLPLQTIYAHWYFDHSGVIQQLHHLLKYGNRPSYGIYLGALMGFGLNKAAIMSPKPDVIVPIPLHQRRFLGRGYNQSTMLAKGVSQTINVSMIEKLLSRPYATRSQTGLNRQERVQNVATVFSSNYPHIIQDKHILLIDDVMTTGATLLSAAKTLHEAGARTINIATLAFTRPR